MSANSLHKLTGGKFTRYKPLLCPSCKWYEQHDQWYGICEARQKLLSNPLNEQPKRNRCEFYEQDSTRVLANCPKCESSVFIESDKARCPMCDHKWNEHDRFLWELEYPHGYDVSDCE